MKLRIALDELVLLNGVKCAEPAGPVKHGKETSQ